MIGRCSGASFPAGSEAGSREFHGVFEDDAAFAPFGELAFELRLLPVGRVERRQERFRMRHEAENAAALVADARDIVQIGGFAST